MTKVILQANEVYLIRLTSVSDNNFDTSIVSLKTALIMNIIKNFIANKIYLGN